MGNQSTGLSIGSCLFIPEWSPRIPIFCQSLSTLRGIKSGFESAARGVPRLRSLARALLAIKRALGLQARYEDVGC